MRNQIRHSQEYVKVTFSRTKDDLLYNFKYGPVSIFLEKERVKTIVHFKRGDMLKVSLNHKNEIDLLHHRVFEMTFTPEYVYIPMKYILEIKEGVSTNDF